MGATVTKTESASASPSALACAREIDAYFARVNAEVEVLRDAMEAVCNRASVTAGDVTDRAYPLTCAMLERLPLFGGGFIAAPGFLADHHLYLAWWQGEERQLLAQSTMSSSGDPLDYTRFEWYRTPVETGTTHLTGPFVDYVCSDEYMLTTTSPVRVGKQIVGVVGADTLLDTFESMMLDVVREADATVINQASRVLLSSDPRVPPGRLVQPAPGHPQVACNAVPLMVLER